MRLIAIMPCRNSDWILGLTARAALLWCDGIAILNHAKGLRHGFSTPRMVNGTPNSLLKLFSLLRTRKRVARTSATASFVEVFPTEPVTMTMRGL